MRYYCFVLNANADKIKDNARINLREYAYENPIAAMNCYMSKSMRNNLCFLAYREEENSIFAAFSYDEKKDRFQDAYDYIAEKLLENEPAQNTVKKSIAHIFSSFLKKQ